MSHAPVTIRPARDGDVPALIDLLGELFAVETDFAIDPARQARGLEMLLAEARARLLAAEADDRAVGMVAGQLVVSTAEGGLSLWAEDLVVEPAWRGRGIGARLMAAMEAWGREQGATRLLLLADRDNEHGLAFNHRHGWETTRMICLRKAAT